jgi:hypothetical protein
MIVLKTIYNESRLIKVAFFMAYFLRDNYYIIFLRKIF